MSYLQKNINSLLSNNTSHHLSRRQTTFYRKNLPRRQHSPCRQTLSHKNTLLKRQLGLTFIEVLMSLTLFTFIAFYLTRTTNKVVQYKQKLTRNLKDNKLSRNAKQVLKTDIKNLFYKPNMNQVIYSKTTARRKTREELIKIADKDPNSVQSQLAQFELSIRENILEPEGRRSHLAGPARPSVNSTPQSFTGGLFGKQDHIYLSALSRTGESTAFSDQNTISYYLKNCKNRISKKESLCLWRKSSPLIGSSDQGGWDTFIQTFKTEPKKRDQAKDSQQQKLTYSEVVILERVKKFEISYYDISSNEWKTEWKTGINERWTVPSALRIQLEFENSRKQIIKDQLNLILYQTIMLPTNY